MHSGKEPRLFFFRTATGDEVDVLFPSGGGMTPVEIKSGATFTEQWSSSLFRFSSLNGIEQPQGLVVYGGEASQQREHYRVVAFPDLADLWDELASR